MTNSSTKGGAYERLCGREISTWLTDGQDDSQLIRSVSSGGWKRRRIRQVGDLAPNGPEGEEFRLVFGVECKNREEFEWRHTWTRQSPALLEWWIKHVKECEDADLTPMILYKRNYQPTLVGFPDDLTLDWHPEIEFMIRWHGYTLSLFDWEEFRQKLDPQHVLIRGRIWQTSHP